MSTKFMVKFRDLNGNPVCYTFFNYEGGKITFNGNRKATSMISRYLFTNFFNLHQSMKFEVEKVKDEDAAIQPALPDSDFDSLEVLERATDFGISLPQLAALRCKKMGLTNKAGAASLSISKNTFAWRLKAINRKLKVKGW